MVTGRASDDAGAKLTQLKETLVKEILKDFDTTMIAPEDANQVLVDLIMQRFRELKVELPDSLRTPLFRQIIDEVLGFGILQPYLDDENVSEILVKGKNNVFLTENGKTNQAPVHFKSNEELVQTILHLCKRLGFHLDPQNPILDEHLVDGSRLKVVLPPIAIDSPILSIQKFKACTASLADLIDSGMMNESTADFLRACVISRLNILIIGQENSGKTALLNALAQLIPENERVVTIEEVPRLSLQQKELIRLGTRCTQAQGKAPKTPTDILHFALDFQPDRLIVDEIRGAECMDFVQAMNTGVEGCLGVIYANSMADAIRRMETFYLMSGTPLPVALIHEQIAAAIDLLLQVSQNKDGSMKLSTVTEISGMEAEEIILTDLFRYKTSGMDAAGKQTGTLTPTGIRPLFAARLEANGFKLSSEAFGMNLLDLFLNEG
jgi:Flp pilus assembly protein, ATPase CpaF